MNKRTRRPSLIHKEPTLDTDKPTDKPTHTPGPWRVGPVSQRSPDEQMLVDDAGGHTVAWACQFPGRLDGGRSVEECNANARLIAAAPELLQTCRYALALLTDMHMAGGEAGDAIRAAIKQATGEAP